MKSKGSQQNRFLKIIMVPVRSLSRARDFYVRSLSNYGDRMNYGNAMAIPVTAQVTALPRSFSVSSARATQVEHDLIRASSTRSMGDRAELDSYIKQQMKIRDGAGTGLQPHPGPGSHGMPPRSTSVAMGRIDEDIPCYNFGEDNSFVNIRNESKYPRSRSHAVSARRLSAF